MSITFDNDLLNKISNESSNNNQIEINLLKGKGYFSEIAREAFKDMVYSNELSVRSLTKIFGVTGVTVRKWLNGVTKRLPIAARLKMASFLSGGCDFEISCYSDKKNYIAENAALYNVPPQVAYMMDRVRKMYEVVKQVQGLDKPFLKMLDEAMKNIIKELLPSIVKELKNDMNLK